MNLKISLVSLVSSLWGIQVNVLTVHSFSVSSRPIRRNVATSSSLHDASVRLLQAKNSNNVSDPSRRQVFLSSVAGFGSSLATLITTTKPALAQDDGLFRPNSLTNPFFEQVRIWEQAEADELRYGGELERGDAGNKGKVEAYPKLLIPILLIADELQTVQRLVVVRDDASTRSSNWMEAQRILAQPKYQKIAFKKIFNAYGDNIYYADPDRANLYLGGGATPKAEQSLAYLLRNDILTNVEALQAELEYLLSKNHKANSDELESSDDLRLYASTASTAMLNYLELVPPRELARARELLQQTS